MGVLSSELLAMLASYTRVAIIILIIPTVAALSIVSVASLVTAPPILCCGLISPFLLEVMSAKVTGMWMRSGGLFLYHCAGQCHDVVLLLLFP